MPIEVASLDLLASMLVAPRAIVLVSVPWSPWPPKSWNILAALETTRNVWFPNASVEFFELFPEKEEKLNEWYQFKCKRQAPLRELHGHGYGPLWWLAEGEVIDCLAKPYEHSLESLQQRSMTLFQPKSNPHSF